MVAWLQLLRGKTILQFGLEWTPFGIVATIGTFLAAWLIPRLAAQWILAIGLGSGLPSDDIHGLLSRLCLRCGPDRC